MILLKKEYYEFLKRLKRSKLNIKINYFNEKFKNRSREYRDISPKSFILKAITNIVRVVKEVTYNYII